VRNLIFSSLLILILKPAVVHALEIEFEETFGSGHPSTTVKILSSTDSERFKPVIMGFIEKNPKLSINYITASTADIYTAIAIDKQEFDVVISSAMDLQMKLANDGFTETVDGSIKTKVPIWARWRTNVFGFALEPVVLLISKKDFKDLKPPKTRRDLLSLIRNNPNLFRERIGTYDPRVSGAGYLFSTQDARQTDTFWRLAEVMGRLKAKLYCCTSQMINAVDNGDLAIAYNVLGSYANATLPVNSNVKIVTLEDYTQILLRTAIIPTTSKNKGLGIEFLQFLYSIEGQKLLDQKAKLPALNNAAITKLANKKLIRLDSGLLVFLDKLKKTNFLQEWEAALIQN